MIDNGKIRLLLADDHRIMRDGLKALLNNHVNIKIVGESNNGEAIKQLIENLRPDVVTLGINIGSDNAIGTVRQLVKEKPDIKIIAHSAYMEKAFICEMLKSGISAYVHKEHDFTELLKAIDAVTHNEVYLCPKAANVVVNGYLKGLSNAKYISEVLLTSREQEILKLLSGGQSSKQMALQLHISPKTVDTHRRQIMNKLNLYSIPELTKYAIRCGLTTLN